MAKDKTFNDLFLDEMKDLYDAEKQLVKALPKLAKSATSPDLRQAIESHLTETERHVSRLEHAFGLLGEEAETKTCTGIAGIVKEADHLLGNGFDGAILDAGIIAGAQRAEHYEIGAYGSLIAWAGTLGKSDVARVLGETLQEEKAADQKLTALGLGAINKAAAGRSSSAVRM